MDAQVDDISLNEMETKANDATGETVPGRENNQIQPPNIPTMTPEDLQKNFQHDDHDQELLLHQNPTHINQNKGNDLDDEYSDEQNPVSNSERMVDDEHIQLILIKEAREEATHRQSVSFEHLDLMALISKNQIDIEGTKKKAIAPCAIQT